MDELSDVYADDRPTLPYAEVTTLPRAIAVPAPPGFDLVVATPMVLDSEALRFFARGDADAQGADHEEDDDAQWWNAQRQLRLRRYVATVMAVCAAVLAAGLR